MGETAQPPPADWEPPSEPEKRGASSGGFWQWRPAALRSFDELSRFAVNLGIIVLFVLVSFVIVEATVERTIIIEPLIVPKAVSEAGYDGKAVAQKLVAEARRISMGARSSKERVEISGESRFADASSIRVPASDLSVRSLVTLLRNFLGIPENRITGELTLALPAADKVEPTFTLALHFINAGKPSFHAPQNRENVRDAIEAAARDIVEEFDPAILAAYLFELSRRPLESDKTRGKEAGEQFDGMIDRLIGKADEKALPWLLNLRAQRLQRRGRLPEAQEAYRRVLQEYPDFGAGHASMALALEQHVFAKDPQYRELSESQRRDVEIDHFRRALRFAPDDAKIHSNLGAIYLYGKRPLDAIEEFRRAIQIDPKYAPAYSNWGSALGMLADEKAPRPDQQLTEASRQRLMQAARQRLMQAADKFRRASELDPRWSEIHSEWGMVVVKLADPSSPTFRAEIKAAIDMIGKALEITPHFPDALYNLGFAHEKLGENVEAMNHYIEAIRYEPTSADPNKGLARVLPGPGAKEAEMAYKKVMELNAIP